ncbi:MAG: hypothetical protein Q4C67_11295 [Deinococcus sp.]|nr:hypothetical protein [Deinococcus sp.]
MRVGSLTPRDLYFCRCTDQEVVRVARQPGIYGGWVPTLVAATPEEREEFRGRAPREQWPQAKYPPRRSAVSEQESHTNVVTTEATTQP